MMRGLARMLGGFARRLATRLPNYEVRDRVLSFVGPAAMVALFGALAVPDPAGLLADHLVEQRRRLPRRTRRRGLLHHHVGHRHGQRGGPAGAGDRGGGNRTWCRRARDRLPPGALQRVRGPGDRGHAARCAWGRPGVGARDPGPPLLARHHGRAAAALRRLGTLGLRGVREPRQLPRVDLVPLTGLVAQLAGRAGRHDGLGRALPLREPAAESARGTALPVDGDPVPALHGPGIAHPLRRRSTAVGVDPADRGRSSRTGSAGWRRSTSRSSATSTSRGGTFRGGG